MGPGDEGMHVRVFMLGWEFPPFISGGLGTACYGLTKAMDQLGVKVTFVLPKMVQSEYATHVRLLSPASRRRQVHRVKKAASWRNVRFRPIRSPLQAYVTADAYVDKIEQFLGLRRQAEQRADGGMATGGGPDYSGDLYQEVHRYASIAAELATEEDFDIIHAHDWMTFPAGIAVAAYSGKPLVVQVHSTEFDRSGEYVNQYVYDIERRGMHAAAKVIAVSNYTRNTVVSRYAVPPEKVEVVYNGVDLSGSSEAVPSQGRSTRRDKVVLFLGRITMQKGPEYFLYAAKRVLEKEKDVKFIMAGDGDRLFGTIELAAALDIGHRVFFTRFLRGTDVDKAYRMADLYVMPSVSEPFGLAPLEALQHNVPVLISKQSGIAEILRNALKVDFWDIDEMANKMIAVLRYPPLQEMLRMNGHQEVFKFRWEDSAARVNDIYRRVLTAA